MTIMEEKLAAVEIERPRPLQLVYKGTKNGDNMRCLCHNKYLETAEGRPKKKVCPGTWLKEYCHRSTCNNTAKNGQTLCTPCMTEMDTAERARERARQRKLGR